MTGIPTPQSKRTKKDTVINESACSKEVEE